jgi:acetate kinase
MRVLVVNAGSSSLKLRLLDPDDSIVATHDLPALEGELRPEVAETVAALEKVEAIGHRVVHGGPRFSRGVLIDDRVERYLESLADLAPLHQPKALAAIEAMGTMIPGVPQVACFDTSFHANMPAASATYAIPPEWRRRWGIRRFGFHGLSHSYASRRAAEILDRPPVGLRIVTCHLGAGASLAAVREGLSVDTTMGFTPLEGLVMATRSGSIDPGIVLWMQEKGGLSTAQVKQALEHTSGLVALAGTPDMREIVRAMDVGDEEARLAFDVYVTRVRGGIAAMAASMGGIDVVTFTGGVGENAPEVRAAVAEPMRFLGIEIDGAKNKSAQGDADISARGGGVRTLVVKAREDIEISREVRRVLGPSPRPN